nr:hypothetical protein [Nocardioides humi]
MANRVQTASYSSPARSSSSRACRTTSAIGVWSSLIAGGRRNGTSAPRSRATSATSSSSVLTTTRSNSPDASATSTA